MNKPQQPFKKERTETDNSLSVERVKTDETFNSGHKDTHQTTDEIISKDRTDADEDRSKQRDSADLIRDHKNTSSAPIAQGTTERTNKALIIQRKSEDEAIENERTNMDKALEYERSEEQRLMNTIVSQERQATDKNLLDERIKTDLEAARANQLLTDEHAKHLETKFALTTREEFVAIVSHDLKNPIGAILSSAEILLSDSSNTGLGDDSKTWIRMIKRNAETSLRLINDLLDMERIIEGKIQLQFTENRIDVLIRDTLESFTHVASAKKILLTASTEKNSVLMCDKDRVTQILSNLVGNAIKFTPSNGSIRIETNDSAKEITVRVIDTGPGIPEDQKLKIFEKFTQIGNKQRTGLGLGLYISKTLVESHRGKIGITSNFGSGSTFWFTLPR